MITASRYHDISCGHRVVGHEGKCRHLHGHNYRVHFTCHAPRLDEQGRVIDFGVIKEKLCMWLENSWDHKFLAWENDKLIGAICNQVEFSTKGDDTDFTDSIVWLTFNPTAENMAEHLLRIVGPNALAGTGVTLINVTIEETRKCSVSATAM